MAEKSLKKSLEKILKLGTLITTKEFYLFIRNLIGLIYHPFLTLRIIKRKHDLSQTLLIGFFVSLISLFCPIAIFYLLYWSLQVVKRNHSNFFVKNDY